MSYAVAVIGLGAMGMGAAQSCVRAGLDTYGVDLSAQARDVLQAAGAKAVAASAAVRRTERAMRSSIMVQRTPPLCSATFAPRAVEGQSGDS